MTFVSSALSDVSAVNPTPFCSHSHSSVPLLAAVPTQKLKWVTQRPHRQEPYYSFFFFLPFFEIYFMYLDWRMKLTYTPSTH